MRFVNVQGLLNIIAHRTKHATNGDKDVVAADPAEGETYEKASEPPASLTFVQGTALRDKPIFNSPADLEALDAEGINRQMGSPDSQSNMRTAAGLILDGMTTDSCEV